MDDAEYLGLGQFSVRPAKEAGPSFDMPAVEQWEEQMGFEC